MYKMLIFCVLASLFSACDPSVVRCRSCSQCVPSDYLLKSFTSLCSLLLLGPPTHPHFSRPLSLALFYFYFFQVVIDAFRLINPQLMMLGQEPRQTTSNIGHLNKPSVQVYIRALACTRSLAYNFHQ